jgi:hypothetical protein
MVVGAVWGVVVVASTSGVLLQEARMRASTTSRATGTTGLVFLLDRFIEPPRTSPVRWSAKI